MTAPTISMVGGMIVLHRSDRGAMAAGGTVSYEVYVGGRWIGWVGDERPWLGHTHGGRRWWFAWRQEGDSAARANGTGYRTRAAALDALLDVVGGADR